MGRKREILPSIFVHSQNDAVHAEHSFKHALGMLAEVFVAERLYVKVRCTKCISFHYNTHIGFGLKFLFVNEIRTIDL